VDAVDTPITNKQGKNSIISSQFLVKSDQIGIEIMEDIWDLNGWPENMDANTFDYEGRQVRITINKPQFFDKVNVVEQEKLNCFWYMNSPFMASAFKGINDYVWKPGNFIVHVTGYSKDDRIRLLGDLNYFSGGLLIGWEFHKDNNHIFFTSMGDFDFVRFIISNKNGDALSHFDMRDLKYYMKYSIPLNPSLLIEDLIVNCFNSKNEIISSYILSI
jgi:hypothetical protein